MTAEDDPEVFLNSFEWSTLAAKWVEDQWAAILLSCLAGLAQQAVDTRAPEEAMDYRRMWDAILQTLNLSPKAYMQQLQEVAFGPDYHLRLVAQKIRAVGLRWLCPAVQIATLVAEAVLVEHYISMHPFKPNNWVMCHQMATLEEVVVLMEAYSLAEAGAYLIPKAWKGQVEKKDMGWMEDNA